MWFLPSSSQVSSFLIGLRGINGSPIHPLWKEEAGFLSCASHRALADPPENLDRGCAFYSQELWGLVWRACNPSYLGGCGLWQETRRFKACLGCREIWGKLGQPSDNCLQTNKQVRRWLRRKVSARVLTWHAWGPWVQTLVPEEIESGWGLCRNWWYSKEETQALSDRKCTCAQFPENETREGWS